MNFLKHFKMIFQWNRQTFLTISLASLLSGLFINAVDPHPFIQLGLIACTFGCIVLVQKQIAFSPTAAADQEQFSWKYLQSLPLARKDLLSLMIAGHLFQYSLYLIWFFSFKKVILVNLFEASPSSFMDGLGLFFILFLFAAVISVSSILNMINYPRRQFIEKDPKKVGLHSLYGALLIFMVGFGFYAYFEPGIYFFADFIESIVKFSDKYLTFLANRWSLIPLLFLVFSYSFKRALRVWINEKKSYPNYNRDFRRPIGVTVAIILGMFFSYDLVDRTPKQYAGSELHSAIYSMHVGKVHSLISNGADLNHKNEFGITPIMVAARQGDKRAFQALLKAGASTDGTLTNPKKGPRTGQDLLYFAVLGGNKEIVSELLAMKKFPLTYEGKDFSPQLAAAEYCKPEIYEQFMKYGYDINVQSKNNKNSSLHLAMQAGCFEVSMILLENGANIALKNKDGKLAQQLLKSSSHNNKQLSFYFNQKTRSPASIK